LIVHVCISNMIQVHALVFPNACTHLHLFILGLYFVGAFSFPAVLRNAIQTHRNHFREHIVTLQTLNLALILYCASVLVLLGSEDDGPEKQDAIRTALAEILYRLVCVISASVLKNTCEAVLGGDNVPQQLQVNDRLGNGNGDGFANVPVPVNGIEASEFQNAPRPMTVSSPYLISEDRKLLTRESFVFPFQNQNPPYDAPMTPQLVEDTSSMIVPCAVNEVGGTEELVV